MIAPPLAGLRVAVDVQHLYRRSSRGDQGAVFALANGTHVTEAHAATQYAAALASYLRAHGAQVLTNDAPRGVLVGEYWTRNREAAKWGANAYLACHVNAGRGRYAAVRRMRPPEGVTGPAPGPLDGFDLAGSILVALGSFLSGIVVGRSSGVLVRGERGAVCIQAFPGAGLILEPFFGDTPAHQSLMSAVGLELVGKSIGAGVFAWWVERAARGRRG